MFSCRMPGSDDRSPNGHCASLRCGFWYNRFRHAISSEICFEVPFDMDGELGIFLEAGRLLLDYHAPTMHDDDMHACMHVYTPWHVCSDLFWVVASLAKLTSELTHAHALRPPRNALEAPRFRRPGYFGTIDLLIRFNRALGSCHFCIHPFRSLASKAFLDWLQLGVAVGGLITRNNCYTIDHLYEKKSLSLTMPPSCFFPHT